MNGFFQYAVRFTMRPENEGGYVDNPDDGGGATNYGVTQRTLNSWLYAQGRATFPVKELDIPTAEQIYFDRYWYPYHLELIPRVGAAIAIFDAGVLFGPDVSAVRAQAALIGCGATGLRTDGIIGPETASAVAAFLPSTFLAAFRDQLLLRIGDICTSRPINLQFKDGWVNRVNRYLTLS